MSTGSIEIGVSSQLTGVYSTPAIFGYLMASAPIVCYGIYRMTQNRWWLFMLFVLLLGLILNAERSALLMNLIILFLWMRHTSWNPLKIMGFCLLLYCLMIGTLHLVKAFQGKNLQSTDKAYRHGTMMERFEKGGFGEAINRICWQVNGIKTVLQHPFLGATKEQYEATVRSGNLQNSGLAPGESIPFPHNHYVNTGLHAGILGWTLTVAFLFTLRKLHLKALGKLVVESSLWPLYVSVGLGLAGAMGNGFFHNAGIFSGEFVSCSMLGFFLAAYQLLSNEKAAHASA